jgi:hypothetical protein
MRKLGLAAALAACASWAHAGFIDFESDSVGPKFNNFQSVDSSEIAFSDSQGQDLFLLDFDETYRTNGLAVLFDGIEDVTGSYPDGSFLIIVGAAPILSLSLDFGNDDPTGSAAGDYAQLRGYRGSNLVASTNVVMNRNDLADQTISLSDAIGFDRLELEYFTTPTFNTDQFGEVYITTSLTEVIDNVRYEVVPEPASLAALGLGLAALRRRNRK